MDSHFYLGPGMRLAHILNGSCRHLRDLADIARYMREGETLR